MAKALAQVLRVLWLASIGLGISALASWLEKQPSPLASHAPMLHTIGSAWLHVGAALLFLSIADQVVTPWFNLLDIIEGKGKFASYSAAERASLARTWAILTAAIILAIAWAGV